MSTRSDIVLGLILVAANLLALNYLVSSRYLRWDLTENRSHTLSPDTQHVLADLDDVMTINCFFTRDLPPGFSESREQLEDLLEEFGVASGGRLRIRYLDPSVDQEVRREAEQIGIPELTLQQRSSDRHEVKQAFMGIGLFFEDRIEVIEALPYVRSEHLEYELLMRIARVIDPSPPTVAFLQRRPGLEADLPPELNALEAKKDASDRHVISLDFQWIAQYLKNRYRVETVAPGEEVARRIDTLVVANPGLLDEAARFQIDQFLMRGGKLALLWPGVQVSPSQLQVRPRKESKDRDEWLAHYGIRINDELVMDPQCAYVRLESAGGFRVNALPSCLRITQKRINADHPVTRGISDMVLPFCSPIVLTPEEGSTVKVLLQSSRESWTMEGIFSLAPDDIEAPIMDERRRHDLAGLVEGEFLSYYAVRPLPDGATDGNRLLRSPQTSILVVGSSDFIGTPLPMMEQDLFRYAYQFFGNAVDFLTTGEAFSGIRTRNQEVRYIDTALLEQPASTLWMKLIGTFSGAGFAVMVGIVLWFLRRLRATREDIA